MSTIEKLKAKVSKKPTPNNISVAEIIRLAQHYGCLIIPGGKHPIKICDILSGTIIVIPIHGKNVKEAYVDQMCMLMEEIEQREKRK